MLEFDANVRTLERLRILLLFLWKTFYIISKQTLPANVLNITLCSGLGKWNDRPQLSKNGYQIWLRKSSDKISIKQYKTFMKSVRPELSNKEVNVMVENFLADNDDTDVAKLVN